MLTLPSIELARAKRLKKPLISCRTASLEVAAAAIQAAEVEGITLLLTLDATAPSATSHRVFAAAAIAAARDAKVPIVVEALVLTEPHAVSWWLSQGVTAITLSGTPEAIERMYTNVRTEARAFNADCGIELGVIHGTEVYTQLVATLAPDFIRTDVTKPFTIHPVLVKGKVPVILGHIRLGHRETKKLISGNCVGVTIHHELLEAFSAGLRTGLRNRAVIDPAQYLGYAITSVRELVRSYMLFFHS